MAQINNIPSVPAPPCCPGDLADRFDPGLFRALADTSRIALLVRLARCAEPCCVSELARCCPTDVSVVSRHLKVLEHAGLVTAEKHGRQVYYTVRAAELARFLRSLASALEACSPPAAGPREGAPAPPPSEGSQPPPTTRGTIHA